MIPKFRVGDIIQNAHKEQAVVVGWDGSRYTTKWHLDKYGTTTHSRNDVERECTLVKGIRRSNPIKAETNIRGAK